MAEELSVLIIGAGTKGAFGPVSHAEAFKQAGFNILGFVDTDPAKSNAAAKTWGGKAYRSIDSAFKQLGDVDVAVVATPDGEHASTLKQLVGRPVRLIFAEKPFTRSAETARALLQEFRNHGQTVSVNYTRQFSTMFQELRDMLRAGELGEFLGGSGFYGNGLYHSGSHMIDLLGMVGPVTALESGIRIVDCDPDDPSVFGILSINAAPFYLGVIPRSAVNAFEATLYFSQGLIRIIDCGRELEIIPVIPRPDYPQEPIYGNCQDDGESISLRDCHLNSSELPMAVAVKNIVDHLMNGTPLLSSAENAIKVLEICEKLAS